MKKISAYKPGLFAFLFTLVLILGLFVFQFTYRYEDELFHKNLDVLTLTKLYAWTLVALAALVIPISIVTMAVANYRNVFKTGHQDIKNEIRKSILSTSLISIICFLFISFISPKGTMHQMALLFDIRMKYPDKEIERTDLNLFRNTRIARNLFELGHNTDSARSHIEEIKKGTIYAILTIADSVEIEEIVKDSIAKEFGFTKADFRNDEMKNDGHLADTAHKFSSYLHAYLVSGKSNIEKVKMEIINNQIEQAKMVGFPFLIFIVFYLGMFLGILNRNQRYMIPILAGIYFGVFPVIYLALNLFRDFAKKDMLSPWIGQLCFVLIMIAIVVMLYKYAESNLRHHEDG